MAGAVPAQEPQPGGAAAGVEVEFIEADGARRRELLSGCCAAHHSLFQQ